MGRAHVAARIVAAVVACVLVSCSDNGRSSPATSAAAPATSAATGTTAPRDDGVLRIGLLTPLTGPGSPIGASVEAAVELAVEQINDAGGVGRHHVDLVIADEGADVASAALAVDTLLKDDVDAIIGPASSVVALSVLDTIVRNQVVACSPTATAAALDQYPDDGMFFRTAPSDTLEAEAIARAIEQTGRSSVGLLYVDDAYGRAFADRLRQRLANRDIAVEADIPYLPSDATDDLSDEVAKVLGAPVIAVIGAADVGVRLVEAILSATPGRDTPIVVNDPMRGDPAAGAFAQLDDADRARLIGVGPRALLADEEFDAELESVAPDTSQVFAVNAYDCVNLVALAAADAVSLAPRDIARRIPSIASSGTKCRRFAECLADLVEGRNVDYDGPSGQLELGFDGQPDRAMYDLFGYSADGGEVRIDQAAGSI